MNKHLLWAIVAICAIGGTLGIAPLLNSSQTTDTSSFTFDMSYQSVSSKQTPTRVASYGQVEQGSFFLQEDPSADFVMSPLLDTAVDIKVTGLIARAKVTQTFTNPTDQWLNGTYVFPLPENAAVDQLTMHIGERVIKATIEPKQKAKKMFQQAKLAGKKASLLQQSRPNLFTNEVANIGPNETIKVTIEYQQLVHFEQDKFTLRFPTTITERYLPLKPLPEQHIELNDSGWAVSQPSYSQTNNNQQPESAKEEITAPKHKVALNISLNPGFKLQQISSDVHPITQSEHAKNQYLVRLTESMIANQDFVLTLQAAPSSAPSAAHFSEVTEHGHYGLIMLMPPTQDMANNTLPREVIFVIDTSGSMAGGSMEQAKQALQLAINDLSENDSFNIVQFDSSATKMSLMPLMATVNNKQMAARYIEQLEADGGTEMLAALKLALATPSADLSKLRQVIFITDGAVGNELQLFDFIDKNLKQSRLFTVGIGAAPNSYFMTEAALMGKGTYTYVNSLQTVQNKMQQLFSKLNSPVLANLKINLPQSADIYPRNLPDLYQGEPLLISYFSDEPLTELQATGELNTHFWQQPLKLTSSAAQSGLATLWARRKIAQLERDKNLGRLAEGAEQLNENIDQLILSIAIQHHIVSSMTSLVAIDVTPTAKQKSLESKVHNLRPKGQLSGNLPQTATPAKLQMLFAILLLSFALCIKLLRKQR
ncbi:marine proteobacterial sortase target protein [Thalassotalea marina]|uniref:Marine proteobacterial sortase target protein n=1 Tax=Thalassotalea marina TaxID=1673741 RepID=A0A919BJD3_9GAMM|nr:marine proteobacterial sortase target protein [Thalassotalea marina]GHF94517.1 marine proteobacterial sortase target protein [Thalassotalea marina]